MGVVCVIYAFADQIIPGSSSAVIIRRSNPKAVRSNANQTGQWFSDHPHRQPSSNDPNPGDKEKLLRSLKSSERVRSKNDNVTTLPPSRDEQPKKQNSGPPNNQNSASEPRAKRSHLDETVDARSLLGSYAGPVPVDIGKAVANSQNSASESQAKPSSLDETVDGRSLLNGPAVPVPVDIGKTMDAILNNEEKMERIMIPENKAYARLTTEYRGERRFIALLDKQPLICGREKVITNGSDIDQNFLEIGDVTPHKRAVSRKHFAITYDPDLKTYFIEVFSRNGIMLNGLEIHDGRHPLKDGYTIIVQHFPMVFEAPPGVLPPSTKTQ